MALHNVRFTTTTIFSVKFIDIKSIHTAVGPSTAPIFKKRPLLMLKTFKEFLSTGHMLTPSNTRDNNFILARYSKTI